MYEAIELSKYIVTKCMADGHPISNLQLQKILYYIQEDFVKRGRVAFFDEIEAWRFGPVVPTSYYHFCGYGSMPIMFNYNSKITWFKTDQQDVDRIVEQKRILAPWDMVEETHKKGGAWDKTYRNGLGSHDVITIDSIKEAL